MTLSNQFGELVTADEVEDALIETLQEWMPTYLMAMEERKGKDAGSLLAPRSWQVVVDDEKWDAQQMPALNVVSAGTNDTPARGSRGTYDATFLTGVVWYLGGADRDLLRRANRWYAAVVREILIQHPPLVGGVSVEVLWMGEEYDTVASDMARTLVAGRTVFAITVDHVVESDAGPIEPVEDPTPEAYPDHPTADEVYAHPEIVED